MFFEPKYAPADNVSVDRPPLTTSIAECLAAKGHSKLMPKRHDPYPELSDESEYLKILREDVVKSVSIYHVTRVTKQGIAPDQQATRIVEFEPVSRKLANKPSNNKEIQQFDVERIAHHVITKSGLHYVVRWYGYRNKENTTKPLAHSPTHVVDAYRQQK